MRVWGGCEDVGEEVRARLTRLNLSCIVPVNNVLVTLCSVFRFRFRNVL